MKAARDRPLPDALVTGGSIGGLLRFQNQDLADARNTVGQLAAALAGAVNRQQSLGLDLGQPAGSGMPLFAVGAPRVLPASTNAGSAGGVGLAVIDAGQLQASDYELAADPSAGAGVYRLTRLADGLSRTVTSGAVVDGLRIDIAAPAPQPGDRFLLQPVAGAASSMRRVLDVPAGLAAASPVTASLGRANTGSATVASLAVTGSVNPALAATVSFTSAGGGYAWELRDSASGSLVSSGSGSLGSGSTIALDGWELRLNGTPRNGDSVAVGRTAFPAADNGNALAMAGLRLKALVAGSGGGAAATLTDAYAGSIADVGVRVQNAAGSAALSASVAVDAESRRSAVAGVNLDEEAARLIQYQQSYQAAAKVLQVGQAVLDTLLQSVR